MSNDGVSESVLLLNAANDYYCGLQRAYALVCIGLLGFRFSATYANLTAGQHLGIILGFILFTAHSFFNLHESRTRFNTVLGALQEYQFRTEHGVNLTYIFSKYRKINVYFASFIQVVIAGIIVYIL
ncbi:MAG: hypothetical protein Q3M24_17485 [Candidatus Electrothrix aestuarii]|uniref:Uncharacterized protein n=1 Tax=Candidatus Electrothrix aestuarii TaxID=3062594 RepID=A0AAU8LT68_9BACT|nr:hypothetical protein [Candidatus Electrothrix aestuarii]WPD21400.1 MAG: hypothetical protein SD837_14465 [Candidatus Electrothrix sp. GW3-3]